MIKTSKSKYVYTWNDISLRDIKVPAAYSFWPTCHQYPFVNHLSICTASLHVNNISNQLLLLLLMSHDCLCYNWISPSSTSIGQTTVYATTWISHTATSIGQTTVYATTWIIIPRFCKKCYDWRKNGHITFYNLNPGKFTLPGYNTSENHVNGI